MSANQTEGTRTQRTAKAATRNATNMMIIVLDEGVRMKDGKGERAMAWGERKGKVARKGGSNCLRPPWL